jgi:hypothetical protein
VAAHADDAEAVGLQQRARRGDRSRAEVVRVEVLEEAFDGADLDVLEARRRDPGQSLVEAVRLDADGRARLDPGYLAPPKSVIVRHH